jgi:hypothetical protein
VVHGCYQERPGWPPTDRRADGPRPPLPDHRLGLAESIYALMAAGGRQRGAAREPPFTRLVQPAAGAMAEVSSERRRIPSFL